MANRFLSKVCEFLSVYKAIKTDGEFWQRFDARYPQLVRHSCVAQEAVSIVHREIEKRKAYDTWRAKVIKIFGEEKAHNMTMPEPNTRTPILREYIHLDEGKPFGYYYHLRPTKGWQRNQVSLYDIKWIRERNPKLATNPECMRRAA